MTNPFAGITDPAILRALVQDGAECERCNGRQWPQVGPDACPVCCGPGKIPGKVPLPNADLDALAACWCEGEWVRAWGNNAVPHFWQRARAFNDWEEGFVWDLIPDYTTSTGAAMRLQEKYRLSLHPCIDSFDNVAWQAFSQEHTETIHSKIDGRKSKCRVLTECALVAALTEAIEGASDESV